MAEPSYLLDAAYEYGRGWGRYDRSHGHIYFAGTCGYTEARLGAYLEGYETGWSELDQVPRTQWKQLLTGQEP